MKNVIETCKASVELSSTVPGVPSAITEFVESFEGDTFVKNSRYANSIKFSFNF